MISSEDVKNIYFSKSGISSGYKSTEVDDFLDEVQDTLEKMQNEKEELLSKIKELSEKNEDYQKEEKYVKTALISVQKVSEDTLREAKIKAENIIKDAEEKAKQILGNKEDELKSHQNLLNEIRKEVKSFKLKLLDTYKEHIKSINEIETGQIKGYENKPIEDVLSKSSKEEEKKEKIDNVASGTINNEDLDTLKSRVEKLGGIKFGDNYNVSEDKDTPINLFKQGE